MYFTAYECIIETEFLKISERKTLERNRPLDTPLPLLTVQSQVSNHSYVGEVGCFRC